MANVTVMFADWEYPARRGVSAWADFFANFELVGEEARFTGFSRKTYDANCRDLGDREFTESQEARELAEKEFSEYIAKNPISADMARELSKLPFWRDWKKG